jgi:hypothetical protein
MSFNLSDYYKALNGESTETSGIWHINHEKRHAYRISSDFDAIDEHNKKINLPPSEAETEIINFFSDKLGQKLKNTKITDNGDGTESIDLELGDRIVTIVMDQSGSMTWNDNNKFRHDVVTDLVNKIEINYPGSVAYNLIEYGSDIIDVLFFGVVENDAFDPNSIDSLSTMITADDEANYDGMRIIRNDDHYPTSPLDGDIVDEGFISRIKDTGLVEGQTYYYTVYTFDKNFKFSEGIQIKVVPQERIVPRSHSNFRSVSESEDLTKGVPFIGSGINRDANTVGIWHMDEGEGKFLYDFSDTSAILEYSKEDPTWYEDRFVPAGTSGLFFDGENDYAGVDDVSDLYFDLTTNRPQITVMAWVFPYNDSGIQTVISSSTDNIDSYQLFFQNKKLFFQGHAGSFIQSAASDFDVLELNKWQHICATYDYNGGSEIVNLYHNGQLIDSTLSPIGPLPGVVSELRFTVGARRTSSISHNYFYGKITEVSVHDIARDSTYINAQVLSSPIYDSNNNQVDTEFIGIKDDNGDRLNVFKYDVPRDYNYVGGEVLVVKNEKNIPSWEEDGTVIYQQSDPGSGQFFVSDPDDYVLGEKYYYRLFTKNASGNVSFLTDSPSLTVEIPLIILSGITGADYRVALSTFIDSPEAPTIGQLITAGNEKTYLRWKQNDNIDSRIARVKIFYSPIDSPDINAIAGNAELVFTGLPTDTKFVHRSPANDQNAFYTIVNVDKYDRTSTYDNDGQKVLGEEFLFASVIPNSDANENTFPLVEVENINYELVDENTVTIGWNQPQKSIEDVNAFFDQTVYIYGAITDEFGDPVSEDTPIKMSIVSNISRETQADNVFSGIENIEFEDLDAYDFFVTRTNDGFFKGILRITNDSNIVSQIKEANFQIQLKVLLPKEGGYSPPNDATSSSNALTEYASLLEELIDDIDGGETETASSDNFYEYHSETINVFFTNPWEVELVSRDNQTVYERCYCEKEDKLSGELSLHLVKEFYNGIYIRATNPFVARAKVKYKGLPVVSGGIRIEVWDAEFDNGKICSNACSGKPGEEPPPPYEGPKTQRSFTVRPPDSLLPIIQGQEETYSGSGEFVDISFVDIPIYAPNLPQAVRLFVKGERSGYSSVKDMYVLFQNILQIDISSDAAEDKLVIDGKDIAEFRANAFIINPDYPNYDVSGSIDESLVTYPEDLTTVEWKSQFVQTLPIPSNNSLILEFAEPSGIGPIYSTDSVPITNGVYSFTRSGTARNIFMGPLAKGDQAINETHEVSSSIVYRGLSSSARIFFTVGLYNPNAFDRTSARFLMEVDGGWGEKPLPNQTYGGGGWKLSDDWPLWADGIHYKKMKISRNPRTAVDGTGVDEFAHADCFRECASSDDNELLELDKYGQIVEVGFNLDQFAFDDFFIADDTEVEILHGDITEVEDPYTGLHYLEVGEEGFIDNGKAFIELNAEDVSDVTYFYIRMNKFVPGSKRIDDSEFCDKPEEEIVNNCGCLDHIDGKVTECDLREWSPTTYVQGKTTVFLNNNPLVLNGGGTIENGIPPCPIGLNEPLTMFTKERKVTDFFFSEEFGNPSNDFLYPEDTLTDKDNFLGSDGKTLVKHNSDVHIRVQVLWRGQNIPDGTPIFVSTGDNTSASLFVSNQSVYHTTTVGESYSYVDVTIQARRYIDDTRTEQIEIFSIYDESGKTERHVGRTFSITLDKADKEIEPPVLEVDPSTGVVVDDPDSPYSGTVHRYDILNDSWIRVSNMSEPKGNGFSGSVGNYIYYMGGLLGNDFSISSRTEQYDILNDEWSDVTSMSDGRFAGMSVTIGDDIYVIGGIFADNQAGGDFAVSTLVEVYRADVDMWEELESLPTIGVGAFADKQGVAFGTAVHVFMNSKNYIYVMSGVKRIAATESQFAIKEYNQRILRYCIEDDEWENSNVLRSNELNTYERIAPKSIVFDNKIIVFEGAILSGNDFIYPTEDFYIDIQVPFATPSSGEWVNVGSGLMGDFPEPKFQSAMAEYNLNPSADHANYYIFGGSNDNSLSLDILENINVKDGGFIYKTSYTITDPSIDLTAIPVGKHGANSEFSDVSGNPYIYLMGGYTINRDDDYVDISFDI